VDDDFDEENKGIEKEDEKPDDMDNTQDEKDMIISNGAVVR